MEIRRGLAEEQGLKKTTKKSKKQKNQNGKKRII
jgi:hypothetical protein